ncbi:MAG: ATP-binding cassette domain-containing protein [Fretibacterium sp.]|nr:ATP-binding cassette domain-containing protein [Fretibacterium sp.]
MDASPEVVLALYKVTFSYDGQTRVLDEISLDVFKGERVIVLGRNGSGKSTLVRILGALQSPLQGACFICGRDASTYLPGEVSRKIGVVFQNPESQIVASLVEDDVAFAPENQGYSSEEIGRRVFCALAQVGLLHKRSHLVTTLSGGEKQRLALAGALASEPDCLLLDEPTAMLDPEGRSDVAAVLSSLHEKGTTILQVTHQLEGLEKADRVLVLAQGRWAWQGAPEDFWGVAEGLGFELPPLRQLARRLRERGYPLPSVSIESVAEALGSFPLPLSRPQLVRTEADRAAAIEVEGLSCRFNPSTPLELLALNSVFARFPHSAWTSILGRTGSGKSTLVQHLNGLYPIQQGRILLDDVPLPQKGEELHRLRRKVGLVFQNPEEQLFCPTVREELAFAPNNLGFSKEEIALSVDRALEAVGLEEDFKERNPIRLSGGERRLVAIASVLSMDPSCLILDEPTAGLDAAYRKRILELLKSLKKNGKTIITVTHDLEMALEFSDRLLFLNQGRSELEGEPQAVVPLLIEKLSSRVCPDLLRVSLLLRKSRLNSPLFWRLDELLLPGL